MKNTIMSMGSKLFLLSLCLISNVYAFAQDAAGATSQTNAAATHSSESTTAIPDHAAMWFNNPIVWIAGGALVFILILVAILSGRNSSRKNEVSRSTTTTTQIK